MGAQSQGSKRIRQWPINKYISSLMIHKITPSIDYNQWLKRLDTQPIKIHSKLLSQRYLKTLGTSEINSLMSPPSLVQSAYGCKCASGPKFLLRTVKKLVCKRIRQNIFFYNDKLTMNILEIDCSVILKTLKYTQIRKLLL